MQSFMEHMFSNPENHPLHKSVTDAGFEHRASSSMAGVATHHYAHPKGPDITLHSHPEKGHSFTLNHRGKEFKGSTGMHLYGARLQSGIG